MRSTSGLPYVLSTCGAFVNVMGHITSSVKCHTTYMWCVIHAATDLCILASWGVRAACRSQATASRSVLRRLLSLTASRRRMWSRSAMALFSCASAFKASAACTFSCASATHCTSERGPVCAVSYSIAIHRISERGPVCAVSCPRATQYI